MSNVFLDQIVNDNLAAIHPSQSITPLGPKPSRVDHHEGPRAAEPQPKKGYHHEEAKSTKEETIFLRIQSLPLIQSSNLRVLRDLRGEKVFLPFLWGEKYPQCGIMSIAWKWELPRGRLSAGWNRMTADRKFTE